MQGPYGMRDVCLSVPTEVGCGGVRKQIELALTPKERTGLAKLGHVLRETIDQVEDDRLATTATKQRHGTHVRRQTAKNAAIAEPIRRTTNADSLHALTCYRDGPIMMQNPSTQKLARIHADPHGAKDFILADAKDADMALAIGAPAVRPKRTTARSAIAPCKNSASIIEQIVEQRLVDIMLMSAQHQRNPDDPEAHLRQQPGHAGGPRQRHHRHPRHARRP